MTLEVPPYETCCARRGRVAVCGHLNALVQALQGRANDRVVQERFDRASNQLSNMGYCSWHIECFLGVIERTVLGLPDPVPPSWQMSERELRVYFYGLRGHVYARVPDEESMQQVPIRLTLVA